jgi:hypothetical protein
MCALFPEQSSLTPLVNGRMQLMCSMYSGKSYDFRIDAIRMNCFWHPTPVTISLVQIWLENL